MQYDGWPISFNMSDNDGRTPVGYLPAIKSRYSNPVIQVINESTKEILYTRRIQGKKFSPPVYSNDKFTVRVGPDKPDESVKYNVKIKK